jgi:hypothetical protein
MLDTTRYGPLERADVDSILRAHDFEVPAAGGGVDESGPLPGTPWSGFHRLLVDIFQIEGAPDQFPLETDHVQSMRSSRMLLELVPARRRAEFLELLADATEDLVRRRLATDPDFELRHFLFRLMARKPHDWLLYLLAGRSRDRSYPGVENLSERFQALQHEIEAGHEFHAGGPEASPPGWPTVGAETWHGPLAATREGLAGICRERFVFTAVDELADFLDPDVSAETSQRRGYVQFIGEATPPGEPVLYDADARQATDDPDVLIEQFETFADRLRTGLAAIDPSADFDLEEMREAGRRMSADLERLAERLEGALPAWDRLLVAETVRSIDRRLRNWMRQVDRISALSTQIEGDRPHRTLFERFDELQGDVAEAAELEELLEAAYWIAASGDDGREAATAGETPRDESDILVRRAWLREVDVLEAACDAAPAEQLDGNARGQWETFLQSRWEALLDEALTHGYEPDIERIALDESFRGLVDPDAQAAPLRDVQEWFLDRYHFRNLLPLERLRGADGPLRGFARTARRFFRHYIEVWMALVVGALLLLDFGDAWIQMAAGNDYVGIGITFAIGVLGTYVYLSSDLAAKTDSPYEPAPMWYRAARFRRTLGFLALCLGFAALVTGGLWWLFSGTDAVLRGTQATLQIIVWTGFSLFVGVFFGLVTKEV